MLTCGGRAVLENVPPGARGPERLILRPEDVEFCPCTDGPVTVRRCEFDGRGFLLTLAVGETEVLAHHPEKVPAGANGRLRWIGTPFGAGA